MIQSIWTHPLVRRFVRGVFILRPALPCYNITWDVHIVLEYFNSLSPVTPIVSEVAFVTCNSFGTKR